MKFFRDTGSIWVLPSRRAKARKPISIVRIAERRGRIVKTTGDGALVEFASAVDATRCAVEIQSEMANRA
jgi:hypothetical protein